MCIGINAGFEQNKYNLQKYSISQKKLTPKYSGRKKLMIEIKSL